MGEQTSIPGASTPAITGTLLEVFSEHIDSGGNFRLSDFLNRIINVIAETIPHTSLALVVWDHEEERIPELVALAYNNKPPSCSAELLSAAKAIPGGKWFPLANLSRDHDLIVLSLSHKRISTGCFLAWPAGQEDELVNFQFSRVAELAPLITAMIQSAIGVELSTRLQQMNALTQEFFERSAPSHNRWDLEWLAAELGRTYQAEGATILLEEEDELRLAASTDPSVKNGMVKVVRYARGQGLTGWVYKHCRSLRIRDDNDLIRRKLGIESANGSYVDRDDRGTLAGQFLGAPLRFGKEVIGVVRLSRRSDLEPFTHADERMLQFIGDLLGAALGNWRRVHRADAILESINEGIVVSRRQPDNAGDSSRKDPIVFANPGIASLLGRPREEVETLDVFDAYAPGEYEKLLPGLRLAKRDAEEIGRGEFGPIRSVLRRKDGSTVPVMISFRIQPNLLVRPPTYYSIAIARDLSEVEQFAEQHGRFLAFLDALEVAYFRSDLEGNTIEATNADMRITGYTREDWKIFKRTVLYEHEEESSKLLDLLRQNDDKLTRHLLELRRKGGQPFWAEVDLRLIRGLSERMEMEGFYRDVTTQMKLQRFLNEKEDRLIPPDELFTRLKQATEFQIDYPSTIGHQIQTPLGSLLGTIENVGRGILSPSQLQRNLRPVIGQLRACSRLVRNLSYMDMVLRRERVRFERVSLRRLIHETEQDFATALAVKGLSLAIDVEGVRRHLDIVYGHPELLRQVLANLVDNAIKYSRPHSTIYLRASLLSSGPTLDIMNRGLPISPADRERIFERGMRSQKAKALIPHGTGLGLWLVREILSLHRATISCLEVEEEPRIYNCFRIVFPDT